MDKPEEPRVGRAADRNVYLALLGAAETCLEHDKFDAISVRKIATLAGVHPAMINYYFGGKKGLFIGLIGFVFGEFRDELLQIEKRMEKRQGHPIPELIQAVEETVMKHRTVTSFVVYELMQPDSEVRAAYLQEHASRCSAAMYRFIEAGCRHGLFRRPSNTRFLAYTLTTTILHPLWLGANLLPIYGFDQDVLGSPEWKKFLIETLEHLLLP